VLLKCADNSGHCGAFAALSQVSLDRIAAGPNEFAAGELKDLALRMSVLTGHLFLTLMSPF